MSHINSIYFYPPSAKIDNQSVPITLSSNTYDFGGGIGYDYAYNTYVINNSSRTVRITFEVDEYGETYLSAQFN